MEYLLYEVYFLHTLLMALLKGHEPAYSHKLFQSHRKKEIKIPNEGTATVFEICDLSIVCYLLLAICDPATDVRRR